MTPTLSRWRTPSSKRLAPARLGTANSGSWRSRPSCGSEPERLIGTRSDPRLEALLRDSSLRGSVFSRAYGAFIDEWLRTLVPDPDDVAVIAVGGYGRQELCPGSDLDILLLHKGRKDVARLAEQLWYPLWDAGLQVDHSVRTVRQALAEAAADLKVAL